MHFPSARRAGSDLRVLRAQASENTRPNGWSISLAVRARVFPLLDDEPPDVN